MPNFNLKDHNNNIFFFRVFGSGFLTHQGAISELQVKEQNDPMDMMEQATRGMDNRVEFYQQNIVTMDMKVYYSILIFLKDKYFQTNVPEPFKAEEDLEDNLKEGLPVGLSDSQVGVKSAPFLIDIDTFDISGELGGKVKYGFSIRNEGIYCTTLDIFFFQSLPIQIFGVFLYIVNHLKIYVMDGRLACPSNLSHQPAG